MKLMKELNNDIYYLNKLKSDLDFITNNMRGISIQEFEENGILKDAMLFKIIQVDEDNQHLAPEFKSLNKNIAWEQMHEMRNLLEFNYEELNLNKAYEMLTVLIPELLEIVK